MIKAAIIGATGYTGSELVSLLLKHPDVEISMITSESRKGELFSDVHPQFKYICDLELRTADDIDQMNPDVCFLALPHRVAMEYVKKWKNKNFKIIDLSGDYRLSSAKVYQQWYDKIHDTPELVPDVPYGLPELYKETIKGADIVANPGCFPTASILALAPLLANNMVETDCIIIDAKTGTTGAGVKSSPTTHFANVNDNFKAYGLKTHRHTIEIEEVLSSSGKEKVIVQFSPHILPVDRGILVTAYATPKTKISETELTQSYRQFYKGHPFIRLRSELPELKFVRGTNLCDIHVTYDERTNRILALSAIDNLVKGAAGQAIQNMNIIFELNETSGLDIIPLQP
ncbi:MAG: N-acetyl-gamma-glutamyl-phosphate reductase [Bacteroidales bacterium]